MRNNRRITFAIVIAIVSVAGLMYMYNLMGPWPSNYNMRTQKTSAGKLHTWKKMGKDKKLSSQDKLQTTKKLGEYKKHLSQDQLPITEKVEEDIKYSSQETILDTNDPDADRLPSSVRSYLTEEEAMSGNQITDIKQTVSIQKSSVELVGNKHDYLIGDEIKLMVTLRNGYNNIRPFGGDQLRVRAYNETLKAYTPGYVIDHNNGTYTAILGAYWPGKQNIEVILSYRRELVRVLYSNRQKLPTTRKLNAVFTKGKKREETYCHPDRTWVKNYEGICNFTEENGGIPWFCGEPQNLKCEDWTAVGFSPMDDLPINEVEDQLFGSRWETFPNISINVKGKMPTRASLPKCSSYPRELLWQKAEPTGYFYNDTWYLNHCKGLGGKTAYSRCLRNTTLLISGDSTTRAWYKYLYYYFECVPITEQWTDVKWKRTSICHVPSLNFTLKWVPHAQPCFIGDVKVNDKYEIYSIPRDMEELDSETRVFFVIHVHMHIVEYHPSVFRERMRRISNSAKRLLERNKHAQILIKAPHTFLHKSLGTSKRLNDYFGYMFRDIMYEEFRDLRDKVVYMDQKCMTISTGNKKPHPPPNIVGQTIFQMFDYVCS